MRELKVNLAHVDENSKMFAQDKLQPQQILDAQTEAWAELGVQGATQRTLARNFLILGKPFEHGGKYYSRILNEEIRGRCAGYEGPTLTPLSKQDESMQLMQNVAQGVPLAWEHRGDGEAEVLAWHEKLAGEAKDGRVLFNLHYKDAWTSLFHEPVHEAAPDGGIGTSPRWIYEGYCEIFAARIAAKLGYPYSYEHGPYGDYARATQQLIDFVTEHYFARAYFLNDDWSYGLLAPIFYEVLSHHPIEPPIDARYIPLLFRNEVPKEIKDKITEVFRRGPKPHWYARWVRLYGRSAAMPDAPAPQAAQTPPPIHVGSAPPQPPPFLQGSRNPPPPPPPLLRPGSGNTSTASPSGSAVQGQGAAPGTLTGKHPPQDWPADH